MRKTLTILGWAWATALAFCYVSIPVDLLNFFGTRFCGPWVLFAYGIFLLLLACAFFIRRVCVKKRWDKNYWIRGSLLFLWTLPLAGLLVDAPPVRNDYTEASVRSSDPAVLASYDTLMKFRRNGGIEIKSTFRNYRDETVVMDDPPAHAAIIQQRWDDIAEARKVIGELDAFPIITDIGKDTRIDSDMPILHFLTLRSVCRIYSAYVKLKAAEGDTLEAARQLSHLHGVTRKGLPYCGPLVSKMIWISIAGQNIQTAAVIARSPHCDAKTLAILKEMFPPLEWDAVSLRRAMICEYLTIKNIIFHFSRTTETPSILMACRCSSVIEADGKSHNNRPTIMNWPFAAVGNAFLIRQNRTLQDLRLMFDMQMKALETVPYNFDPAAEAGRSVARSVLELDGYEKWPGGAVTPYGLCHLPLYNISGRVVVSIAVPSFGRAAQKSLEVKIRSDLLYLEIGKRLGEPLPVLVDPYTKAAYTTDAQGHFFSPGRDGKPGTADDITLEEKKP